MSHEITNRTISNGVTGTINKMATMAMARKYSDTELKCLIEAIELLLSNFDINIHTTCEHVKSICVSCHEENVVHFLQTVQRILQDVNKEDIKTFAVNGFELISIMNIAALTIKQEYLSIMRLPAAFLKWLWSYRESHVLSEIDFELLDSEIQADLAGVLKQFETSEAYLEGVENHFYYTNDSQLDANVMDRINIDEGTTFIGKLQKRNEDEMQQCDQKRFLSLIELIKLYVCITFLRSTILLRVRCIAHAMDSSPIVSGIINAINKEEETVRKFIKRTFEQPTYNRATFFGCFNPSVNSLICSYVKSKEVKLQTLKNSLHGKRYFLRSQRWPNHWAVMSNNPWGTIWSTIRPNDRESVYFEFQSLSMEDNYFLIKSVKWMSWYVYMNSNGSLRGTNEKTGPQREWKIIKFVDGKYMMCTRKWPGKFIYMKDTLFGGVGAAYCNHTVSGHWSLEN